MAHDSGAHARRSAVEPDNGARERSGAQWRPPRGRGGPLADEVQADLRPRLLPEVAALLLGRRGHALVAALALALPLALALRRLAPLLALLSAPLRLLLWAPRIRRTSTAMACGDRAASRTPSPVARPAATACNDHTARDGLMACDDRMACGDHVSCDDDFLA